jgi:hypothetical protein
MAKRGRKPAARVPRAGAPNMAVGTLRASRKSSGGRMPVHFRHTTFGRSGIAAPAGRRQRYIERQSAVDLVERPGAIDNEGYAAAAGNLGTTPEERTAFWTAVSDLERKNGRLQYGIIAELPHEVSPAGRLDIMERFLADEIAGRELPHWGVIHRPDAHNDPRNFHVHVLYYSRPGRRDAKGGWDFSTPGGPTLEAGQYPWGTVEKPNKRITRLEDQLTRTKDPDLRGRYQAQITEARSYAEAARTRVPSARSGPANKSRHTYPWGIEDPSKRLVRLRDQLARATNQERRKRYETQIAEVTAHQAAPTRPAGPTNVHDRDWVKHLRDRWCDACNRVLEREGFTKRYHPGGYKDLGIDVEPTKHLGTKAAALEAQGHATAAGQANSGAVLRNLLRAGEGEGEIRLKSATEAATRRATWAALEAESARAAGRADRADHWDAERQAATSLVAAIERRLAAETAPQVADTVFAGDLRSILKMRSALPEELPEQASIEPAAISMRHLVAALLPLVAKAEAEEQPAPAPTASTTTPTASPSLATGPTSTETTTHHLRNQAKPAATSTADGPAESWKSSPAKTTSTETPPAVLWNALAVAEKQATTSTGTAPRLPEKPPSTTHAATAAQAPVFRLRPGATTAERTFMSGLLENRPLTRLYASARANTVALQSPDTSPYVAAALRGGSELLREAIALAEAKPAEQPKIKAKISLRDAMRSIASSSEAVIVAAAELDEAMPAVRPEVAKRVATGLAPESAAETIAPSFGRSVATMASAGAAAAALQVSLSRLASDRTVLADAASSAGGLGPSRRLALEMMRDRVLRATDWIPRLPGEQAAPVFRAEAILDPRGLAKKKVTPRPEKIRADAAKAKRMHQAHQMEARRASDAAIRAKIEVRLRNREM